MHTEAQGIGEVESSWRRIDWRALALRAGSRRDELGRARGGGHGTHYQRILPLYMDCLNPLVVMVVLQLLGPRQSPLSSPLRRTGTFCCAILHLLTFFAASFSSSGPTFPPS